MITALLLLALQEDAVDRLVRFADVGTDAKFKAVLAEGKKRADHTAPVLLRGLLTSFRVLRWSFGQGYSHEGGKASLSWWSSEIGVAGDADEIRKKLADHFRGYEASEQTKDEDRTLLFTLKKDGVEEEIRIRGPVNWVGGRETACGFELGWKITDGRESARPTLAKLVAKLPILKDDRIDADALKELGESPVESLAAGGTWTRYYDWDVVLFESGADGHAAIRKLLARLGYEVQEKDKEFTAWQRKDSGSYAWLYPPDKRKCVRLRFQPES